ncbi:class I adenylate-forming enzyme family protein [Actinomadura sp. DC4]|uniref:class I adenylate-forming enzyme family protein n=1 Tax=Actinomadura sp. DC4 TaxID=3055069 RepID=UPI0025B205C3|nr:class I adenylate-forming enzyme family protein [Actinomadura sp. DC4]MDN3354139.1 class I adenylate-forming enzyme family protein [Actinomadura sp. DC4]
MDGAYEATFAAMWSATVTRSPDAPFLVFSTDDGTHTWSYGEFDRAVAASCRLLTARGVGKGDAVHLALRNSPAFVALWLAAARIGAWIVPADPAATERDLRRQAERTGPAIGFCAGARAETYHRALSPAGVPVVVLDETADDVRAGGPLDAPEDPAVRTAAPGPADRLAVMWTSGTTSEPKGVVLTQANYAHVAGAMARAAGLAPTHRWLVVLPLFHANAQFYCFAPAILTGASVALTATFSASRWVRQADRLGATHASLFAAPMRMILARTPPGTEPARLQHVWFAQNVGSDQHQEFGRLAGTPPRQLYGMTETLAVVTADDHDPPRHDLIGPPLPGRAVRLSGGQEGVITVRGTRGVDLFAGYLDAPDLTNAAFEQGAWFRTGDVAREEPDGALRFLGRSDDIVKIAGENVSLSETEAVLSEAPGVLEVAVTARPDPVRDHLTVAHVVPRDPAAPPEPDALAAWAEHQLASAARPREWHIIDELPRTSVGKIRRFALRDDRLAPNTPVPEEER